MIIISKTYKTIVLSLMILIFYHLIDAILTFFMYTEIGEEKLLPIIVPIKIG